MSISTPRKQNILLRSLALQLFLNYKTMQGAGYLFALKPELVDRDPEKIRASASFINGHPVFSSVALGALSAQLQEPIDISKAQEIATWKLSLSTPLGAIGDSLIWERFKPAMLALVVAMMLFAGDRAESLWGWTIVSVLSVYNVALWAFRNWAFNRGYQLRERVTELALHPALPVARKVLRALGIGSAALVIAFAIRSIVSSSVTTHTQFIAGFLIMVGATVLRYSTLTTAFLAVLASMAIYFFTTTTSLMP